MVVLKTTILMACLAASSTSSSNYNRAQASPLQPSLSSSGTGVSAALVSNAPAAKDLQGIHLLLDNDVDSKTPKNPVILLSKPRFFKDFDALCAALGEKLAPADTPGLQKLLDTTPVAANEVKRANRYWVSNGSNGNNTSKCMAFDRKAGRTLQLSCSTKLPALCTNSLPRTEVGGPRKTDKSKQIKVNTPMAGAWQGYRDQNQFRFLGIPYAESPTGNLRFQKPMRLNPSKYGGANKVNDATKFGNVCTQIQFMDQNFQPMTPEQSEALLGAKESEDCLYLNVFTPALKANRAKGLPVMVYVHGGSFTSFGSSVPIFEPGNVVSRGGVVVVSINYRLSTFGLFENIPEVPRSKAPGNLATRDQIAALRWVRNNIVAFGGDPSQVTIFGESAGGWSMRGLLSAPSAFGLYKNVISQSDLIGLPFSSPKYSSNLSKLVMQNLGCKTSDLDCARNKTTAEVSSAQAKAMSTFMKEPENQWVLPAAIFRPTVDKSLIPADFVDLLKSGKYNKNANVLWGYTKDEGNLFVPFNFPDPVPLADMDEAFDKQVPYNRTRILIKSPYYKKDNSTESVRQAFGQGNTDYYWTCPMQIFSRAAATQKSNVYTYRMDHGRGTSSALGTPIPPLCVGKVCHADDIIPSFGSGDAVTGSEQTGDDARFARQVIDRFTTFAKTGNPNPNKNENLGAASQNSDLTRVQWPKYDQSNPIFAFSVANSRVVRNGDTGRCNWLNENDQYDFQVNGPSGKFVPLFK
ncbi:MAG: Carboxylesterase family-domain-containing protein [Linnemannia gamsii]|nr:MAG: Carboxylesterase family-domain-containing protein [Linnemannia gamsii]